MGTVTIINSEFKGISIRDNGDYFYDGDLNIDRHLAVESNNTLIVDGSLRVKGYILTDGLIFTRGNKTEFKFDIYTLDDDGVGEYSEHIEKKIKSERKKCISSYKWYSLISYILFSILLVSVVWSFNL